MPISVEISSKNHWEIRMVTVWHTKPRKRTIKAVNMDILKAFHIRTTVTIHNHRLVTLTIIILIKASQINTHITTCTQTNRQVTQKLTMDFIIRHFSSKFKTLED